MIIHNCEINIHKSTAHCAQISLSWSIFSIWRLSQPVIKALLLFEFKSGARQNNGFIFIVFVFHVIVVASLKCTEHNVWYLNIFLVCTCSFHYLILTLFMLCMYFRTSVVFLSRKDSQKMSSYHMNETLDEDVPMTL